MPRQDLPPHIQTSVTKPEPVKEQRGGRDLSQVTCFRCRQQGHISPNCPKKPASKVRRVRIQEDLIQTLKENEVFGAVGPYRMPITLDTGADITVVPEESVEQDQFIGETCELRSFNDGKSRGRKFICTGHGGRPQVDSGGGDAARCLFGLVGMPSTELGRQG